MIDKNIQISSNRSFGIVFSIFFIIVAIYYYFKTSEFNYLLISLSVVFLILGLLNSKILMPLNFVWFKFGIFLGYVVAPVIMAFIYFLVVTPIGYLTKLSGKNLCNLKRSDDNTYWINKNNYNNSMKNQF